MSANQKILFWLLLLVGLFFRLFELGRASYQIDEINVVQFALQEKGLLTAYHTELDRFLFMHRLPLLMVILHAAIQWFGASGAAFPSEFVTRLPFALIGLASLPLFYGLGRRLAGPKAGLWVMALACFSPFHLFYSREAYDYSMLLCFAVGVLWAGLELLDAWISSASRAFRWVVYYNLFAAGLLYAHLSGLVFLAMWCSVLGVILLLDRRTRAFNKLVPSLAILGLPFLLFLPFLVKLLGGGWVDQDSGAHLRRITWAIIPSLLGRLGWGEAWWVLLSFVASLALGARQLLRRNGAARVSGIALLVHLGAVFVLQAWLLRVARFEVRYFAVLQPTLLLLAGVGIATLFEPGRVSKSVRWVFVGISGLLFVWLGFNAWLVTQLECRGANFKGLARWLNENLPDKGLYCFWNGYELRGVPNVYTTPGRFATFPVTWSTEQDYQRFQVQERLVSLFQRFPMMAYVEYFPSDVLDPSVPFNKPVPRDELFTHQLWLKDPAFQKMADLKTLPLGDAQWFSRYIDHVLISYNRQEDLPELARRHGQSFYHYYGPDWQFTKDQQMNDWLVATSASTLIVGNLNAQNASTRLRILAMAMPQGGRLNLYGPGGRLLENAEVTSRPRELVIDQLQLPPGETRLFLEILPPPGSTDVALFLHGVNVSPSEGSAPAH